MKRYYSAHSAHGSRTSHGFSNDTVVLAFDSKKARDNFVDEYDNISVRAITAREVVAEATNWDCSGNKPYRPATRHGEYWGIVPVDCYSHFFETEGVIGTVEVCRDYDHGKAERLYR